MNWPRSSGKSRSLLRLLTGFALGAAVAFGLYACKNSDGDGVVAIGLTDKQGDFLTYTVDVTSLTLIKADGTFVAVQHRLCSPMRAFAEFRSGEAFEGLSTPRALSDRPPRRCPESSC